MDKNGNFYYGLGNTIHVFDQDGNKLRGTTLQASDNVVDLEFIRDGNLLVLTGGKWGKIIEITQSGVSNK